MSKIAITTTTFGEYNKEPLNILDRNGFQVQSNPYQRKLRKDEVIKLCKGAVGIIAGTETLDVDIMETLTTLKVISRCGTGTDNVALVDAERMGIKVFNTPDSPTSAVAELTVGLMINLLRNVSLMEKELRMGQWKKRMGNLLSEKRIGIKGFGRIGKKVAELLKPFGCEIAYADPFVEDGLLGLQRLSLKELLCWADLVTIHVGVNEKLIGEEEFKCMKDGAIIINTSRGGVVDESALYGNLKNGHLAGAALDVFEEEPYSGPLKELGNIILTPHIGSYARDTRVEMEEQAVANLLTGLGVIE
jgi:D-3-phosphoglycerate dehydrogenase|tara:strand:+ start:595 stop:1506 length:912 start_codon:yes stop_codon:yes gene_type:complete